MADQTATSIASKDREREMDERTLHGRMKWFTEKWAMAQQEAQSEFQADLLLLIQAIHRDASRETHALLTKALMAMPPQPIFIPTKSE